jgi:hypothetical protein
MSPFEGRPALRFAADDEFGRGSGSVLGTDGKGNFRPSGPVLVVVRKL